MEGPNGGVSFGPEWNMNYGYSLFLSFGYLYPFGLCMSVQSSTGV
jgi:hypothetical protein